ncbi:MAG: hypothetical protein U0263_25255 [Polyangiaceae bacterium]
MDTEYARFMQACPGCAVSAGAMATLYVVGRVIAWWANRVRMRAMAQVERES